MTTALAVGSAGWTDGLPIIALIGFGVVVISLLLARSLLPDFMAHLFSMIIGTAWSFWVTAQLLPHVHTWTGQWRNMMERLIQWYILMMQGGISYDNLMFIFQMGLIVWASGYLTIWMLLRVEQMWQALLPCGLVLLINLYYAPKDITAWFIIYIMLSLLLLIRFNLLQQEARWRAEGTFFRTDISFDFFRDGFIFSVLVMSFAWLMPPFVDAQSLNLFDEFQGTWQDVQQNWNRMYANLNYRPQNPVATFGRSLSLGGARNLTNNPVMDVQIDGGEGRYWRAAVYDEYNGLAWRSTDTEALMVEPGQPLSLPLYEARQPVSQTYTLYRDGLTVLYALNYPIGLDRSVKAIFHQLPSPESENLRWSENGKPWLEEITYLRSKPVGNGESYHVVSLVSKATVEQLQQSGTDYPTWLKPRYVQLPDSVTARTRELANTITAPFHNNYDKARAVENYLRATITYNDQIPLPPSNVDRVDYVLFVSHEAYCDYYASAMVVMLRAVGIPTRLVAGFAQGRYDADKGLYRVVDANAHSWTEVYFPQYGWINFEPTSAQPSITRPTAASTQANNPPQLPTSSTAKGVDKSHNIPIDDEAIAQPDQAPKTTSYSAMSSTILLGIMALMGIALVVWWQRQPARDNIFKLYPRMVRLAAWLGVTQLPWQTPYEYATVLKQHLPAVQSEINTITTEYVQQTFGNTETTAVISSPASQLAWQQLRPEMLKTIVKRFLPKSVFLK